MKGLNLIDSIHMRDKRNRWAINRYRSLLCLGVCQPQKQQLCTWIPGLFYAGGTWPFMGFFFTLFFKVSLHTIGFRCLDRCGFWLKPLFFSDVALPWWVIAVHHWHQCCADFVDPDLWLGRHLPAVAQSAYIVSTLSWLLAGLLQPCCLPILFYLNFFDSYFYPSVFCLFLRYCCQIPAVCAITFGTAVFCYPLPKQQIPDGFCLFSKDLTNRFVTLHCRCDPQWQCPVPDFSTMPAPAFISGKDSVFNTALACSK